MKLVEPHIGLENTPSRPLREGTVLYRLHLPGRHPMFSDTPHGRFNLSDGEGTSYFARTPEIAISQTIAIAAGRYRTLHFEHLQRLTLTSYRVATPLSLANINRPAKRHGIPANLNTYADDEFAWTRRWARALRDAGFDGVSYRTRYSSGETSNYVGMFGQVGDTPPVVALETRINVVEAALLSGFKPISTPTKSQLLFNCVDVLRDPAHVGDETSHP